jgi:hypothetical protein
MPGALGVVAKMGASLVGWRVDKKAVVSISMFHDYIGVEHR